MKYVVVTDFTDKNDKHIYRAGDTYPRPGVEVSKERVAELTSADNMRGEVLVKAVDVPQKGKISSVKDKKTEKAEVSAKSKKQPKKAKKKEK